MGVDWCRSLIVLGVLMALAMAAAVHGSRRWEQGTQKVLMRLEAARTSPSPVRCDARQLDGLPAPVQRLFRAALTDGQAVIAAVSIRHAGTFNMSATAEQWKPFTSQQRVITQRPGFEWDARIMMFPGVPAHAHDAYVAGEGLLRGALFGLAPVVNIASTPEIARGELLRFFAERVWYPTSLLPSQGVRWSAVDETSARATLTDGSLTVTLRFHFNSDGMVHSVRAESRERVVDGKNVSAPWEGRFWNYAERNGMRVPLDGEVAGILPEGVKTYWRGTTTALSHEFARQAAEKQ